MEGVIDMAGVFSEFWKFDKEDTGETALYRWEMTDDEVSRAQKILSRIKKLGITIGNPENGGKWWNYDKWTWAASGMLPTPYADNMKWEMTYACMECRKWEALSYALYLEGYPHDLKRCIKYWVCTPTVSDDLSDFENIYNVIEYLWECPGLV